MWYQWHFFKKFEYNTKIMPGMGKVAKGQALCEP